MKRSDIIQNPEILSINCQEDYFRYTDHAADIHRRLRSVSKNALVALVGNDGVGKTFLVQMMESINTQNNLADTHWLYFDVADEHLKDVELWDAFKIKLTRKIRLNVVEGFWADLRFMIEAIERFIPILKKSAFKTILSGIILFVIFISLYITVAYVLVIAVGVVLVGVFAGFLPPTLIFLVIQYFHQKTALKNKKKHDNVKKLLLRIKDSKKNIVVAIDGINEIGQQELLLLQKVKRLLNLVDNNIPNKEMRVIVPLSRRILASCIQKNYVKHFDYIELFQPKISTDQFIKRTFTQQFIERVTLVKCKQLVDTILEASNQNLHVLKLIMRTAEYQNKHIAGFDASDTEVFKHLNALSSECLSCLVDPNGMTEKKELASPGG